MDNTRIKFEDLSTESKQELEELVNNQENAFDLLLKNYENQKEVTTQQIVQRMQMQYFAKNPIERELKTNDHMGWEQREFYEPNEVNVALASVGQTNDEQPLYSSFALKEVDGVYSLRYPLDDSFATIDSSFADLKMPDYEYNRLLKNLERNLKVKVREDNVYTHTTYKTNFFKNAIVKIKNAYYKLTKNYDKIQVSYSGCIKLNNKQGNYKISNVEKVVKIYDSIFGATIKKQAYLMKKKEGAVINKDISFASRIYANLLMSRVTNFGNPEINKKVERSLALQFANILNRNNFDPEELQTITKLATNTAADACKSMGITKKQIVARMILNGYEYSLVPENEFEALLYYKEKDYQHYNNNFAKVEEKAKVKVSNKVAEAKVEEKINVEQKSPLEIINEVSKQMEKDNEGFNFLNKKRIKLNDEIKPVITAEQINSAEKSKDSKYAVQKSLQGIKESNIEVAKQDIEEISENVVSVQGYQPDDPLYISFDKIAPKTQQNSKPKKKFSDLKVFRGIKKAIQRAQGIYKLRTGEISKFDYDEFIEDAQGFGFIRNGVAHSKPQPEYGKVTKDQIQYVLDVQSGQFLPESKKEQVPQLEAAPELLALPVAAELLALPAAEEFLALPPAEDVKLLPPAEDIKLLPPAPENVEKTIDEKLGIVNEDKNQVNDVKEQPNLDIDDIADKITEKFEDDNKSEENDIQEEVVQKQFADKVIRGKVISTPEGNVAKINEEQIQKFIDKVIEDHLKEISVKIDNAIATKQYYKYGGKKHCENIRDLCLSTARYYAMHANNKEKKIKTNNAVTSIDGMAKFACGMLLEERKNLTQDILEGQQDIGPERKVSDSGRYENIDTVINRMYRKYYGYHISKKTHTEKRETGFICEDTMKGHFKVYIKKLMVEYGKFTKKESSTNK